MHENCSAKYKAVLHVIVESCGDNISDQYKTDRNFPPRQQLTGPGGS